jgi:hypothetical protein
MIQLGIHAKPHFATPYPGSEWYYTYKTSIKEQYGGDLEKFILDLGDASKITAVISHNFTGLELLGLQAIIAQRNTRVLDQAEKTWARPGATSIAVPQQSFNFRRQKIDGPIEPALAR